MWTVIIKKRDKKTKLPLGALVECGDLDKSSCPLKMHIKNFGHLYAVSMSAVKNSKKKIHIQCTDISYTPYVPKTDLEDFVQKICANCKNVGR